MDRLTIPEYELLMTAARYREVDKDYRNHLQAFLNFCVQSRRKAGKKEKPVYNTFTKFYNYEKELEKVKRSGKKEKSRYDGIGKYLRRK